MHVTEEFFPDKQLVTLCIEMYSRFTDVDDVVRKVLQFFEKENLHSSSKNLSSINLALRELLVNAVEHGNKMKEEAKIVCHFSFSLQEVCIVIIDGGTGFILEDVVMERKNLNADRERGRGLLLLAKLGWKMSVHGNRVQAIMKLQYK